VSQLAAQFEMRYPQGATIRAELTRPAEGFSVTALFGPSGCGKTTVLRSLAGLERPQQGTILFGGDVWLDSRRGIHRTPPERNVGFLFQEYALFPHLTVAQNTAYGLRRTPAIDRRRQVGELLERFGLTGLERRFPTQISGGQQQRVALARTLARKPRLLLLDEPLSALDTALREQMRLELRSLLTDFDIPMILVTHDRHEAIALADHLIVMGEGRILQSGPVDEVFSQPKDERVARMVGVETVQPGRVVGRSNGTVMVEVGRAKLTALASGNTGESVLVCIRAEDVEVTPASAGPYELPNRLAATIGKLSPDGAAVRLELDCGFRLAALIPRQAAKCLSLEAGSIVAVHLPAAAVYLIPQSRRDAPS
jgi:molybdate transport system ATP-binding protein